MFLSRFKKFVLGLMALATIGLASSQAVAQTARSDYLLGPGDVLRIQVFQSQDLTVEARISESGVISYPLLGVVKPACRRSRPRTSSPPACVRAASCRTRRSP